MLFWQKFKKSITADSNDNKFEFVDLFLNWQFIETVMLLLRGSDNEDRNEAAQRNA